MSKRRGIVLIAVFFTVFTLPSLVWGQAVKGTLVGTITDSSRAVIPGVTVTINEASTNLSRSTKTNDVGYYAFPMLEPGSYTVEAELAGFKRVVRGGVAVSPNTTVRVDLAMSVGEVADTMTVEGAPPILQTDRVDIGMKIEGRQLEDMPLGFNRNYQSLLSLLPGVGRAERPSSQFYNSQDSLANRANGQSRQGNNFQLEGLDNNWDEGNLTALVPPIEAIATVDVTTSNYDAEFGRATGAVTNVTLRSGSNNLHGSVFAYNRVSALAARSAFAHTKAPLTYNLYGFAVGGPIRKDRTFFFADFQGMNEHMASNTRVIIPTMEFRAGDLSAATSKIYDPTTGNPDGSGRLQFPNNQIPAARISPIAKRILDVLPPPTYPGLGINYESNDSRVRDTKGFDVKIDHQFSPSDSFFIRYSLQHPVVMEPTLYGIYGGPRAGAFAGDGRALIQSPGLSYVHVFNSNFLTELRFGVMRLRNDALNADYGKMTSQELGIPGVNLDDWTSGMTTIAISGFSSPLVGYSAGMPWKRSQTNFNLVNNWTRVANTHMLKFGFDMRRERNDLLQTVTFGPRGAWTFTDGPTRRVGDSSTSIGNAFAAFLLDLPNSYGRALVGAFPTRREFMLFSYIQDKWQVSPKLTLDLGLRHEFWPAASPCCPGGMVNYDPDENSLLVAGVGQVPMNNGINTPYKSFAPRVGFSYRINERTVFRSGYGISYLFRQTGSYTTNYPVKQANSYPASNSYSAAGSMAAGFPAPVYLPIPEDGIIRNAPLNEVYYVIPTDFPHPYMQSWNVALQRSVPLGFVLEAAYIGNHGVNIMLFRDINAGLVPGKGAAGQPLNIKFGRRNATYDLWGSHTNYHSLQVKFDRRFADGLSVTTSYTWGKAIDIALTSYIDMSYNRGRSSIDRTHMYVNSFIYELPFGSKRRWLQSGVASWILGGWQVNGIFRAETGAPLNFSYSATSLNMPSNGNRPNVNGEIKILGGIGPGQKWFDTGAFSAPPAATLGNIGRGILAGPGYVGLDLSAFKRFPVKEGINLELRAESFNVTNTPAFGNPNTTFGSSTFGEVSSASGERQIQMGLRLTF
jgi:hypothetical protein